VSKARDLLAAAQAVIQYAEKKKLDASREEYAILQPLKDEIAVYEISETKLRAAAPAVSH
jgi:hypothetical protein